jgi:hypothetical protein
MILVKDLPNLFHDSYLILDKIINFSLVYHLLQDLSYDFK